MKKQLFLLIMLFAVGSVIQLKASTLVDKSKAKIILMKTNRVIGVAQRTLQITKNYTGKFGKSVQHARLAKKYYDAGEFDKAVYHSLYGRKLATEVLKENNAKTNSDSLLSADETAIIKDSPSEMDLDANLSEQDKTILKDEEIMGKGLGIEVL